MVHRLVRALLPLTVLTGLLAAGCGDSTTTPGTVPVAGPNSLVASSDDGCIHLAWQPSADARLRTFAGYRITMRRLPSGADSSWMIPGDVRQYTKKELTNGVQYEFRMRAVGTDSAESRDSVGIIWAPAHRLRVDIDGNPITLYSIISGLPAGLDFANDSTRATLLDPAESLFRARGEIWAYMANFSSLFELVSADLHPVNPGAKTEFVPEFIEADSLSGHYSAAVPASPAYTAQRITIPAIYMEHGIIYHGRTLQQNRWHYFRMLVRRSSDGAVLRGAGFDAHVVLEFSYQTAVDVPQS